MPRACTICSNKQRDVIDREIARNVALRKIAQDFRVSYDAVYRHAQNCVTETFTESERQKRRDGLLGDIDAIKEELYSLQPSDIRVRLDVIDRKFKAIDHEAKLTGAYVKDKENPATNQQIAREVVAELINKGWSKESAARFASERYKVAESELLTESVN